MSAPVVVVHPDADALATATAARLLVRLLDAQSQHSPVHVGLTGGGMGGRVLAEVASSPLRDAVDWTGVHVWWGDERFLPEGDPQRNETQARAALLDALPLPAANVHAVPPPGPDVPTPERVSLAFPAIEAAEEVWLVVAGADKAPAVARALAGAPTEEIPAAAVRGRSRTLWLLDVQAAG